MRTRFPALRTLPSSSDATLSFLPIVARSSFVPLNCDEEVRAAANGSHIVADTEGSLVPLARVLLQAALENAREIGRDSRQRGRRVAQDRGADVGRGLPAERPRAGDELVDDDPEREQVGSRVD